jgi:hypothetical protein
MEKLLRKNLKYALVSHTQYYKIDPETICIVSGFYLLKATGRKRKTGQRLAGVEPDNLAGVICFIIPPLQMLTKYLFLTTLYFKQGNSQKVQSCSNQLNYSPFCIRVFCGRGGTRTRDPVGDSEVTLFYGTCFIFKRGKK